MDCSSPGSSVHGILQARTLEWVAMSSTRVSSQARDRTHDSCIASGFFTMELPGKPLFLQFPYFYLPLYLLLLQGLEHKNINQIYCFPPLIITYVMLDHNYLIMCHSPIVYGGSRESNDVVFLVTADQMSITVTSH